MHAVFLDFDGVVIDSLQECCLVSTELYYRLHPEVPQNPKRKDLFLKYRGIAGPAAEMMLLHDALTLHLQDPLLSVEQLLNQIRRTVREEDQKVLEQAFFACRTHYQEQGDAWCKLNPLTPFGRMLQKRDLLHHFIVTTKNRSAVMQIIQYYEIRIPRIFDVEDYRKHRSKGKLIQILMDSYGYESGIFVDDSTGHLDTLEDPRVTAYFADWGYGQNTHYPVYPI